MANVASRDLRNHTGDVLRRVTEGERITVTQHGRPVAEISPAAPTRPAFFSRAELAELLLAGQADPALRDELSILAGETTDDLGPIA
ncbi:MULTISPECIES: type II toxin-antitoxin system Phd/YefM family antitoxin [unclassified Pseudactinotalea]|uniref:type II toxin-antitoxin system Phd/YefM family antitoxin n=1 Tax=unclassified Pseudactinotalea TaxID=2649176 RepID=UPI00128DEF39|nr:MULTISPECIES: type II toxin-antitoxin system prevent-host-death family antitoxin [unclassified Pseudactinotalea]MPV49094.1 type II toxin-antitoxin system prevent-host-death family antitoxin [Pseudactinotalea sp. HY160]QGH68232.1 type II toxin-antitoxin system prevent-host-death family antitoxin [Pseudactinotalea sp. HY158]